MLSDEEKAKLFRIWKTTLEMLRDREYFVLDSDIDMNMSDFLDKFGENFTRENLDIPSMVKKDDPNDKIFVFFPNEQKLSTKVVKRYSYQMRTENIYRAIIVSSEAPTPYAKRVVEDFSQGYYLEFFLDAELLVNVNKHMLVPKHEVLTNEQKKALLKHYKVKETQLPRMQSHDPIARYFGIRRGQVVKIIRDSETAGKYVTYRVVF